MFVESYLTNLQPSLFNVTIAHVFSETKIKELQGSY